MRKAAFAVSAILLLCLISYTALGFYTLQVSSPVTNASCAIGNSGTYIPRFACVKYLGYQLEKEGEGENAQSVLHLAIGAYPTDGEKALEVMSLALSNGAQVNGFSPVSGYTPLHEAILFNEPRLFEFLMQLGADPQIEDQNKGLHARQLLSAIRERNPNQDFAEIEAQLQD